MGVKLNQSINMEENLYGGYFVIFTVHLTFLSSKQEASKR